MGAGGSTPEGMARAELYRPLRGASVRLDGSAPQPLRIVGTLMLDVVVNKDNCQPYRLASPFCCGTSRRTFSVGWPCPGTVGCWCFDECACCPHLPRGAPWEAALADGFGAALLEAAGIAMGVDQSVAVSVGDDGAGGLSRMALEGTARAAALAAWTPRANALLARHNLSCYAFTWIEEKRDDKGNKTGEMLLSAVQVYDGQGAALAWAKHQQHIARHRARFGGGAPGAGPAGYAPPAAAWGAQGGGGGYQQQYQQQYAASAPPAQAQGGGFFPPPPPGAVGAAKY